MAEPPSDRKCYKIDENLYRMDQVVEVEGQKTGYDATGEYWVFGVITVVSGKVWFYSNGKKLRAPADCFVMAMPPRSVVSVVLKDAKTANTAIFSHQPPPEFFPKKPISFGTVVPDTLASINDIKNVLNDRSPEIEISRCTKPNRKSYRAMDYLSHHFNEDISLPELSAKLTVNPEVLSRTFREDWGKPPIHFRNWLRVLSSFRHLAEETSVTDIAYEVGFNDLSRFHKQFKSTVGYTPLGIRKRSKNAKN